MSELLPCQLDFTLAVIEGNQLVFPVEHVRAKFGIPSDILAKYVGTANRIGRMTIINLAQLAARKGWLPDPAPVMAQLAPNIIFDDININGDDAQRVYAIDMFCGGNDYEISDTYGAIVISSPARLPAMLLKYANEWIPSHIICNWQLSSSLPRNISRSLLKNLIDNIVSWAQADNQIIVTISDDFLVASCLSQFDKFCDEVSRLLSVQPSDKTANFDYIAAQARIGRGGRLIHGDDYSVENMSKTEMMQFTIDAHHRSKVVTTPMIKKAPWPHADWQKTIDKQHRIIADQRKTIDDQQKTIGKEGGIINDQMRMINDKEKMIDEQQKMIDQKMKIIDTLLNIVNSRHKMCATPSEDKE